LQVKGQKVEAVNAYLIAWQLLSDSPDYKRLVQAKLNALGQDPETAGSAPSTGSTK
jgi:predicted negative regulator of RcsB-dependent stress response